MYLNPIGEDTLLLCTTCEYRANRQIAGFRKPSAAEEDPLPGEEVATPGVTTIAALAEFLRIDPKQTAKAVMMMAAKEENSDEPERFIFAVLRGDLEVNETKLANAVGAAVLRPATGAEIRAAGAVPGYASPVGLRDVLVVADDSVTGGNLVAGANREGFHLRNVRLGRDYTADVVTDIAAAREGDSCPECGAPMRAARGIEMANTFQLGTRYSEALDCRFLDSDGVQKFVQMGSYGMGVGRLMACIAEEHCDEHGLCWPAAVAPFSVHIAALGCLEQAGETYETLQRAGIDTLLDDRNERAGVQFHDADLIGAPVRLTVSERSLKQAGAELKLRRKEEKRIVPLGALVDEVRSELGRLMSETEAGVAQD
jgi:prolyl-tRNA synthetase